MKVVVTGGGTGGHIYPAIAIAKGILKKHPDAEIQYIGTKTGMETKIVPQAGLSYEGISASGWQGRKLSTLIKASKDTSKGYIQARKLLKSFQPDYLIGTGGYVCLPLALAAGNLKIPVYIHEQNAFPGLANKMISRFAKLVFTSFPEASSYFDKRVQKKIRLVGLPVREEILTATKEEGAEEFQLDPSLTTLCIAGGSLGAKSINNAVLDSLKDLLLIPQIQIIWATGKRDYEEVKEKLDRSEIPQDNLRLLPYISRMDLALALTSVYVGRAGATTLSELTAKGIGSVLIPYPYAASDHQTYNAKALEKEGAAILIPDKELSGKILSTEIKRIIATRAYIEMGQCAEKIGKPQALDNILEYIC